MFLNMNKEQQVIENLVILNPVVNSFKADTAFIRKEALSHLQPLLNQEGIDNKIYINQNINFEHDLEWFMETAIEQILDTAYLKKKTFSSSHLRQYCLIMFLEHGGGSSPRSGRYGGNNKYFSMQTQILLLNPDNKIIFYDSKWGIYSGYDYVYNEIPIQIKKIMQPFLIRLKRVK